MAEMEIGADTIECDCGEALTVAFSDSLDAYVFVCGKCLISTRVIKFKDHTIKIDLEWNR